MAARTHGKTETPEYKIWSGMHTRCFNKKRKDFEHYGGRGISICDRWKNSFENFLADMGPRPSSRHSIERTDNDGNYEPGNCKWATPSEQANNKRNNVMIIIDGVERSLSEWAREYGVEVGTVWIRYKQGLTGLALFKTTVQMLIYNGITDTVKGWSNRTGIKSSTISMRINSYKWPVERALTEGAIF